MDRIAAEMGKALAEQHDELWDMVDGLEETAWQRHTRCPGWSAADVVLHMAQTEEMALASLQGTLTEADNAFSQVGPEAAAETVDDLAAWAVARERGAPGAVVAERWRAAADGVREAFAASDPRRRVLWVSGELSALSLATTRLAECWIHTGDVAEALGVPQVPGARLRHIARLAWRTLPYAFQRDGKELSGPVAFNLTGPDGEPWDFVPDDEPTTVVTGAGADLCLVAARRVDPDRTSLEATGPDATAVLALVRTYA